MCNIYKLDLYSIDILYIKQAKEGILEAINLYIIYRNVHINTEYIITDRKVLSCVIEHLSIHILSILVQENAFKASRL